jgi:uncharacterized protein YjbI with pentapeptide repeats
MLKRGDDEDEVDDEVRTTVPSQNHATATLSTEESFLRIHRLNFERLNFERPNFVRPNFERTNFERPDFERPNFERPNFERPNFERLNFEKDRTFHDRTSNRTELRKNRKIFSSYFIDIHTIEANQAISGWSF